jgi:hypothetical protein
MPNDYILYHGVLDFHRVHSDPRLPAMGDKMLKQNEMPQGGCFALLLIGVLVPGLCVFVWYM